MHKGGFFSGRRQRLRWGGRLWVTRGGLVTGQLVAVTDDDLGLLNSCGQVSERDRYRSILVAAL